MDCMAFFKELKREFLSRGMEFRYRPDKFAYGDLFKLKTLKSSKNSYNLAGSAKDQANAWLKLTNAPGCISFPRTSKSSSKSSSKFKYNTCEIVRDDQDVEFFSDFKDMVYRIALRLAKKIGRLPASLHARMVLSTDGHPAVKKYIDLYGS